MLDGVHVTDTDVMVGAVAFTVTAVEPDFVASCTDVAVIVALPPAAGVNTPVAEIVPLVAVQVTDWLKPPVPETVDEHWLDWPI